MLKYIVIIQIFLSGLFAHSEAHSHVHFFNSLHLGDFVLLLVSIIIGFTLFKRFFKKSA